MILDLYLLNSNNRLNEIDMSASNQAVPSRTSSYKKPSDSTRAKILDAAEVLFVEKGFAATSVRAIADLAAVNLAATHYHFGSKEGLLAATIHRRAGPINAARLTNLDQLEMASTPAVEEIVKAFFEPLAANRVDETLPNLIARLYGEPDAISGPLLQQEFGVVSDRYLAAFERALPGVGGNELRWRFHFFIGAMVHLLSFPAPLGMKPTEPRADIIKKLEAFVSAGLIQNQVADRVPGEKLL